MSPVFTVSTLRRLLEQPVAHGITQSSINGQLRMPNMTVICSTCQQPINLDDVIDYEWEREPMDGPPFAGLWRQLVAGPWEEWTIWHAGHQPRATDH